ncbi:MAG: FUSC family protein [Microbacterium sp.]
MTSHPPTRSLPRVRAQFGVLSTLRSTRLPRDAWYLRAGGVVFAALVSLGALAIAGRIDLGLYALTGSMTALFTHSLPYRRRASTMAGFVAFVTLGCTVAMMTAAALENPLARIGIAVVLAAIIKVAHDASAVGAPTPVIPIFLVTALTFSEQSWAALPLHAGLVLGSGAIAWLVVMAPSLARPHGPERRAVATAVLATIPLGREPESVSARDALASSIAAAWRTLELAGSRTEEQAALEAHVVAAERVLADPSVSVPERARANARTIERSRSMLPAPPLTATERRQLRGIRLDREAPHGFAQRHPVLSAFRPSSPSMPYFWRVLAGCLAAALVSYALGGDRPFWAITSAAVIVQPNLLLTWRKSPPRALGAVIGVGLFALLAPVAHLDPFLAVAMVLVLNALAELFVPRNYLVGQAFVTPMALLMSQFGAVTAPTGELIVERLVDTVVGVIAGLAAAFLIRNGHLRRRAKAAVDHLESTALEAESLPAEASPTEITRVRRALIAQLAEVSAAVRSSDSEWWTHRVDETRVVTAQKRGHAALASLDRGGE